MGVEGRDCLELKHAACVYSAFLVVAILKWLMALSGKLELSMEDGFSLKRAMTLILQTTNAGRVSTFSNRCWMFIHVLSGVKTGYSLYLLTIISPGMAHRQVALHLTHVQ